jgi:hypothetical protein
MTLVEIWDFIQTGGIAGLLFLALLGVFRGWWIPRHVFEDLERDRDEWKSIALQNMHVASTAVDELKERRPSSRAGK